MVRMLPQTESPTAKCANCGTISTSPGKFCAQCGVPVAAHSDGRVDLPLPDAERRHLSVMFCDVVDSTSLAAQVDPEDLLTIMSSYRSAVVTTVERFGGCIAGYMGDGALAYFGWPRAEETDAEHAVRAGMAVIEAIGGIQVRENERLRVRIGIATGLVVIGNIEGPGHTAEVGILGEAPNLAARLQGLAEPNTILITHLTRALVGQLFTCCDVGELTLKGYPEPVRVWRVQGDSSVRSRSEALHVSTLPPMIGREKELALLLRRWDEAQRGHGQVVVIAGEPGIGKSRLVATLEQRLSRNSYMRLRYFCAPHQEHSALHPIIAHLAYAAGFERTDTAPEKSKKLRALMAPGNASAEDVALVADLLALPPEEFVTLNLSPERRKQQTFVALLGQIERLSWQRPLLLLIEDLHWSDPSTLELIDLTIERISQLPALLILTFRPEFRPHWSAKSGVTSITLSRFAHRETAALIAQLNSADRLQRPAIDRIVEESDGVPLFIEELTKAALERAGSQEALRAGEPGGFGIPGTLQASLMARLDRLPTAKEVAQIGAIIGREFPYSVLTAVAEIPEATLLHGLDQLLNSELVFAHGVPPNSVYTFKHSLIQDAAYESLLRSRRSSLHAKLVDALLQTTPNVEETHPALLGYHCAQAGLIEKAAAYYRRAGERSAARAAMVETLGQLQRGLALLKALPDSTTRRILEVELKLALGRVLLSTSGSSAMDAGEVFESAVVLCRGLDRVDLLTRGLWGYWFNRAHRDMASAEAPARELVSLATIQRDASAKLVAGTMLGISHLWQGRLEEARLNFEEAAKVIPYYANKRLDLAIVSDHIEDHLRIQLALTLTYLGHIDQAAAQAKAAVDHARTLRHMPVRAIVLAAKCRHDWFIRNKNHRRSTTELLNLSEEQGIPFYLALARGHLGWLEAKEGRIVEGLELLHTGLAGLRSAGAVIWEPFFCAMMADAESWAGKLDDAERLLEQSLEAAKRTGGHWLDPELHRRSGQIHLLRRRPDYGAAERCFRQAISIAQQQSARLWELRAATDLARLWSNNGQRAEARKLLTPLHAWFTEGLETPNVADAFELLRTLTD
jgi:class 3 adenylate cyclase/predicted ATPase